MAFSSQWPLLFILAETPLFSVLSSKWPVCSFLITGKGSCCVENTVYQTTNKIKPPSLIWRVIVKCLGPVCNKQNCLLCKKKSVNRKPFLVQMNFFSNQSFLNCHQSSKMPLRRLGGLQFFVKWQTQFVPWQLSFVRSLYFANTTN